MGSIMILEAVLRRAVREKTNFDGFSDFFKNDAARSELTDVGETLIFELLPMQMNQFSSGISSSSLEGSLKMAVSKDIDFKGFAKNIQNLAASWSLSEKDRTFDVLSNILRKWRDRKQDV